ncbi:MAG TPA: FAD-dependent oxidoreductase, partial [Actinomycetota bacterium]
VLAERLKEDGVEIRTDVTAERVERDGPGRVVHLTDGSTAVGSELLIAIGRRPTDLRELGLEEAGIELDDRGAPPTHDDTMRIGDGVLVAGDAAGGPQFTHVAVYHGRVAAMTALGREARADLTAVPKAVFTDPEIASVGLTVEEARDEGIDAFEETTDFAATTRGFLTEGSTGHLTVVVDRERRQVLGAFAAAPAASELIHLPALAIKLGTPLDVLVDNITAFPTGARELTHVFDAALKKL